MNPYDSYSIARTLTDETDKIKLLLKLFEVTAQRIDMIRVAIEKKDYQLKYVTLTKVEKALEVLRDSLDLSQGEIAANLFNLYSYLLARLAETHRNPDCQIIDSCKAIFTALHEGFRQAHIAEKTGSSSGVESASGDRVTRA